MAFGLSIESDRAKALQQSIQDELVRRGFSPEPDAVMAEYITIMIINNKTSAQITSELEDLIGGDFESSFTDWLFEEVARSSAPTEATEPTAEVEAEPQAAESSTQRLPPPSQQRNGGVYQQALNKALNPSPASAKRSASARSPSPNGQPSKVRRTEAPPTGPRAMARGAGAEGRSLIDRMGPRNGNGSNAQRDEIQNRIDNITQQSNSPAPNMDMMMQMNGFPGAPDMNALAMNPGMNNPMMLQEVMMNQMALMAQITGMMGPNQFAGFPMGMPPGDMNGFPGQQGFQGHQGAGRGRGNGRGRGRGRGGHMDSGRITEVQDGQGIVAPVPRAPNAGAESGGRIGYALPERPQSPTLCKFAAKCTNAQCRYSHPSPVATPESGVVLSLEHCEQGKDCKDKDCMKAHVSPAVLNPQPESRTPAHHAPPPPVVQHQSAVPCRFGAACTRSNCTFSHPPRPNTASNQPCRFGTACTRASCTYQHPEGRVLPSSFHRGLSTTGPSVTISAPETGSVGNNGTTANKTLNLKGNVREKLAQQMKELEQKKSEAEKAVKDAQQAAAKKQQAGEPNAPIAAN